MPDHRRVALVVVDMQNAFIAPAHLPAIAGAEEVVYAVNECVADAVPRGWPIFYTKDVAPFEIPDGDPDHQTDLYPGLDVRGVVVPKGPGKHGGFSGFVLASPNAAQNAPGQGGISPLAGHLLQAEVDAVIVIGLAGDVCVAATARDARRLGYHVTVPLHATAFVHAHPKGDQAAVDDLRTAGIVVTGDLHAAAEPGAKR
jgi:nicotinamidase/pyrazinamidase